MSASDALGQQFTTRRADQLRSQGMSLVRPGRQPDVSGGKMRMLTGGKQPTRSAAMPRGAA